MAKPSPNDCKHSGVYDHLPPKPAKPAKRGGGHWDHIPIGTLVRCESCDQVFVRRKNGWDVATPKEAAAAPEKR